MRLIKNDQLTAVVDILYCCLFSWTTRIVLPLKPSVLEQGQMRSLAARFYDVHPSLLLFLHRLRHLTVVNEVSRHRVMLHIDCSVTPILIHCSEYQHKYFCFFTV